MLPRLCSGVTPRAFRCTTRRSRLAAESVGATPPQDDATSERMCVVLDTNIWYRDLLLRTPLGAAFLHILRRMDARLGLPEVVEIEAIDKLTARGVKAVQQVEKGLHEIQSLTGRSPKPPLPSQDTIREHVESRLAQLDPLVERVPLSIEQTRAALHQVTRRQPPSSENREQFKDSLIWQAILDLGDTYRVLFVTADRAFFADRDTDDGLAQELRQMCKERGVTVEVFPKLGLCLERLQEEAPPLDEDRIGRAIQQALQGNLAKRAAGWQLVLGDAGETQMRAFATEHLDRLAIDFDTKFSLDEAIADQTPDLIDLEPERPGKRNIGFVAVEGSCYYSSDDDSVSELRLTSITWDWANEEGQQTAKDAFVQVGGAISMGVPYEDLNIRGPLQEE